MNKFCQACGKENPANATYCGGCGAPLATNAGVNMNQNAYVGGAPMLPERNIVVAIILALCTCGIYSLYWVCVMNDDVNKLSGENGTSGGMVVLLGIITCGIYYLFWYYKMGEKLSQLGQKYGKQINDFAALYLILGIFGFGIVNLALIQNDLNKFAK